MRASRVITFKDGRIEDEDYDIKLKKQRLKILKKDSKFKFYKIDLINKRKLKYPDKLLFS